MSPYVIANSILIGFFSFAAVHYLILWWLSRRESVLLVFALHCLIWAVFNPFLILLAKSDRMAECQIAVDARTTLGLLVQVTTVWLLSLVTGLRARPYLYTISLVCPAIAGVNLFVPLNGPIEGLSQIRTAWGEPITFARHHGNPWVVAPLYALVISVQVFSVIASWKLWARDRLSGFLLGVTSCGLLIADVWGIRIDILRVQVPYAGALAYAPCVLLFGMIVSREYRRRGDLLQASENRLRTILDHTFQLVGLLNPNGTLLRVNRTALDLVGVEEQEVIGKSFWETPWWSHSPELRQLVREGVREAAGGKIVRFEATHPGEDGRIHDVDSLLKPVENERGEVVLLIFESHEITERKRMEEALALSEAKYRTLIETAPDAIVVMDVETGVFTDFNEKAIQLFEMAAEELRKIGPVALSPERQPDGRMSTTAAQEYIQQTVDGGRPVFEWLCRTPTGKEIPAEVRLVRLPDKSRLLVRGSVTDISERKHAEEALRVSEEQFRSAFEYATIGMALVGTDGRWLSVNRSLCEIVGYSEAELLSRDFQSVTHPDDLGADVEYLHELLDGSIRYVHTEKRYIHKRGHPVWVHLSAAMLRDSEGKPKCFMSQIQDINERKNAEEKQQEYYLRLKALSQQILETQEKERRRLARELHDEIGQMLTTLTLRLYQLKNSSTAEVQKALDEDIGFVSRAIEQVREMSLNLRPPMLDVLGLEAALRWFAESQRQRSGLEIQLKGHLEHAWIDPELEISCFRVVQEAVTNILRHAQAARVEIELEEEETELILTVHDDGVGFDLDAMQKRAGQGGSFGILAMRERVELLGGTLEIESAPMRGTSIRARFPWMGRETNQNHP